MGISISVLGIGNLLMSDEGVGVHAIKALEAGYHFPEGVRLLDGGTMGLDLLYYIEGTRRLLIIDAVNSDSPPATVKLYEGRQVPAALSQKFSVHQIGLQDLLFALDITGAAPEEICLAGVQPRDVEVGLNLSDQVEQAMPALINAVIKKLEDWGVQARGKMKCA
ncbi:MAG: HyaD/HybD family hydrogenase maturation endopeptidase [Nitrospiraceae bacterium]|nr:HyaD/HybD family hydrogenase maturation endopeptidase [Nitrospiraceae bacterium]MDA8324600.1 HyaD/HybD family hydrogenase maturation endopeptidase [Nitrospiraceae bacterium]